MWCDAPLSDDWERLPRLAASAAPAAICCFLDFDGIQNNFAPNKHFRFYEMNLNNQWATRELIATP